MCPLLGSDVLLSISPPLSLGGLDEGDVVVVPLNGGHSDPLVKSPAQLLAAARMIHFLVAMSLSVSLPPQSSRGGQDDGEDDVDPLDGIMKVTVIASVESPSQLLVAVRITTKPCFEC